MRRTWVFLLLLSSVFLAFPPGLNSQKKGPRLARPSTRVKWEGWEFDWAVRKREGLVLTDVSYRGRSVLKYAGLAEIFTIYDKGDNRLLDFEQGSTSIDIRRGIDCSSGEWCKLFDQRGNESKLSSAQVMMHEEKTGPNYLGEFGRVPGKRLVLWMPLRYTSPPDGYTFVIAWKFRDDGILIPEIGATGVPLHLETGNSSPTGSTIGINKTGRPVADIPHGKKIFAPSHVHSFLYRLDFDIDGQKNVVEEFNWEKAPRRNPRVAPSARCTWTPIRKETGRSLNPETFRSWRVVNRNSRNALGHPRSYQLLPGSPGIFRSDAKYNEGKEAAAQADLWVTRYKPGEMGGMEALSKEYVNGENVENQNVVLWYWLSFHHLPRSEDWMHQPMVWCSFQLMPRDFLDESPLRPGKR